MADEQRCENCRFAVPIIGDWISCRRYPPNIKRQSPKVAHFPETQNHRWCGEWQAKEEEA